MATLCGRLFFIVAVIQLVFLRFAKLTPLQIIRALALPATVKRVLAITLSLIGTLRHAIDRAHIALIAAGTLTRSPSWRNILHSWRLIQAVWLSAITIMVGRMRDKWPVENTHRAARRYARQRRPGLVRRRRPHLAADLARRRGRHPGSPTGSAGRSAEWPRRELISGPNFSGRSGALMALLRDGTFAPESFYIGPYSEAALSGLSSTIADEIELYGAMKASFRRPPFSLLDVAAFSQREPQTLSGGEQVLLALHCFSLSGYRALAIDTALEQLDQTNRDAALDYPRPAPQADRERRADRQPPAAAAARLDGAASARPTRPTSPAIRAAWSPTCRTTRRRRSRSADSTSPIATARTSSTPSISRSQGGAAYRLAGPNGAGKTTLLKLLVGVLAPSAGEFTLGDRALSAVAAGQPGDRARHPEPRPPVVRRDAARRPARGGAPPSRAGSIPRWWRMRGWKRWPPRSASIRSTRTSTSCRSRRASG